jgi:dihydroorotate dehydrogenase
VYKLLIKPILFLFPPEQAHYIVFTMLRFFSLIPGVSFMMRKLFVLEDKRLERNLFGIKFKNPVGLAAGMDKDACLFQELSNFGFGFIEIGTATPLSQSGNPRPRSFRLPKDEALINRMGFNNNGVEQIAKRLKKKRNNIIIGGNIGKNKSTPNDKALHDYMICFKALHDYVDYFVVNVSSPNTPNLRELQDKKPLSEILLALNRHNQSYQKPKPILLKIAPDLSNEQLDDVIDIVKESGIAGVIAANTTISRQGLKTDLKKIEKIGSGGLSGKPLKERSTEVIKYLSAKSGKAFSIIGVGGIHSPEDAIEKLNAGADLIQLYTGFIYEGPGLVKRINKNLIANG